MNRKNDKYASELSTGFTAQLLLNAHRIGLVQIMYFLEGSGGTTLRLHITEESILFPTTIDNFRSTDLDLPEATERVEEIVQATLRHIAQGSSADVNLHRLRNGESALHIIHKDDGWTYKIISDAS